jgi:CheY-like chemotaxis protein
LARILLVDDHVESRQVIAQLLEMYGHTVQSAESAEAAWDQITRAAPDAVVVDHRLPGMSGLALLDRVRCTPHLRTIPVIVCSGDDSQYEAAMSAGATDFWIKGADKMFEAIAKLGKSLRRNPSPDASSE